MGGEERRAGEERRRAGVELFLPGTAGGGRTGRFGGLLFLPCPNNRAINPRGTDAGLRCSDPLFLLDALFVPRRAGIARLRLCRGLCRADEDVILLGLGLLGLGLRPLLLRIRFTEGSRLVTPALMPPLARILRRGFFGLRGIDGCAARLRLLHPEAAGS